MALHKDDKNKITSVKLNQNEVKDLPIKKLQRRFNLNFLFY